MLFLLSRSVGLSDESLKTLSNFGASESIDSNQESLRINFLKQQWSIKLRRHIPFTHCVFSVIKLVG